MPIADNLVTILLSIVIAYQIRGLYLAWKAPNILPEEINVLKKDTRGKLELIDVRSPRKYDKEHIKGAKNVHLSFLGSHMEKGKIPKDKKIVLISSHGTQTGRATMMLIKNGYDAVNLKGGHRAWQKFQKS